MTALDLVDDLKELCDVKIRQRRCDRVMSVHGMHQDIVRHQIAIDDVVLVELIHSKSDDTLSGH